MVLTLQNATWNKSSYPENIPSQERQSPDWQLCNACVASEISDIHSIPSSFSSSILIDR